MEVFSEIILNLWNKWAVRAMILLSLFLQIILVTFGSRRKFTARSWYRIVVWSAYLTADWVATVALGNLASSTQADSDLHIFWAPFLLLHLGGPDTITAYSLEDNELWRRHLLGLVVQVGVAFYVFLRSWGNSALTFIAIPIFITGIIKYGERTFVLRSSSAQQLKNSLLPDPGNFVQWHKSEERKKQKVQQEAELSPEIARVAESESPYICIRNCFYTSEGTKTATNLENESLETGSTDLQVAYFLFKRFRYLFADSILGTQERIDSRSKIENKSSEDAFKLIAIELGFLYDLLYTKATIVYSPLGILFRVISFIASVTALVLFSAIIDIHSYSSIDVSITYILLIGAVVLEVYAFCVLLFSDWTVLWYAGLKKTNPCATFPCHSILANRKRWSRSMAQYNLVSSCLHKIQPGLFRVQKLPWIGDLLGKYQCLSWEDVDMVKDIEDMIFSQLKDRCNKIKDDFNIESCRELLAKIGDYVLEKWYGLPNQFCWSTTEVEFDHSFLLWHIATDLCYYSDLDDIHGGDFERLDSKCRISKCLSDYILYLWVFNPSMLPEGIGEIRYRDTFEEARIFFMDEEVSDSFFGTYKELRKKNITKSEACNALLQVNFNAAEEAIKGDKSQSLLFYGCRLAKQLKSLENKWEVISEVWVEMLTYASNKCRWKDHGQQLRKGGELLTHVRLLMVHLGLSEQYRIENIKFDIENVTYLKVNYFRICIFLCFYRKCSKKKQDTSQV